MPADNPSALGAFLKARRARLAPETLGFPRGRRRTPGLRREEVALRAHVSTTWYTWLEQGRNGTPSGAALERIAKVLALNDAEREHLFLLALGHPPGPSYHIADGVAPRLQRVLDALAYSPAIVRSATWDVLAWNRAAAAVLTDYGKLPVAQRNILRLIFCTPHIRQAQSDWEGVARYVVETFRADVVRADAMHEVQALVGDLCERSRDFKAMWNNTDVRMPEGGIKRLHRPGADTGTGTGTIALEFSNFAVDGRAGLSLMVYNPATPADAERVRIMVDAWP